MFLAGFFIRSHFHVNCHFQVAHIPGLIFLCLVFFAHSVKSTLKSGLAHLYRRSPIANFMPKYSTYFALSSYRSCFPGMTRSRLDVNVLHTSRNKFCFIMGVARSCRTVCPVSTSLWSLSARSFEVMRTAMTMSYSKAYKCNLFVLCDKMEVCQCRTKTVNMK